MDMNMSLSALRALKKKAEATRHKRMRRKVQIKKREKRGQMLFVLHHYQLKEDTYQDKN